MKAETGFTEEVFSSVARQTSLGLPAHAVMVKQSLHLGVVATVNAGSAVLMAWYVVARVGVNVESDAFFASSALPQFVFAVLATTLVPVLVPLLAVREDNEFRDDATSFFSLIAAIFFVLAILLGVTGFAWVPLIVPGFSSAGQSLCVYLTRIQLANMVLNAMIVTISPFAVSMMQSKSDRSVFIREICGTCTVPKVQ